MSAILTDVDLTPAGWYPDPIGSTNLRRWDGHAWTNDLERPGPHAQPAYGYSADGAVTRRIDY
jgi:hypothetical protein